MITNFFPHPCRLQTLYGKMPEIWLKLSTQPRWKPCIQMRRKEQQNQVSGIHYVASAVYTGIKKPESFSHSGFSLKVARQLPLNTKKKTIRKTHLRSVIFWNSAEISLVFCQCKRSLQSPIIRVFGHVLRDLQRNHPTAARDVMRTTRVRSKVERSRSCACTTYQNTSMRFWFFAHALFVPKTPNVMGFSGSVNGTTKNPGFGDFGFCQCKWAYSCV